MSPKAFVIRLNKSPAVFTPGEIVAGEVFVELREAKSCRGISLRFKGRAKVHWSERRGSGKNRRTVYYTAEENYFGTEVYLVGSSNGEIELVAGQHIFPFTFPLPMNIPNSFEHKYGEIGYNIKAVIDIKWGLDDETYLPFTVNSPLDLSHTPSIPIEDEVHEDYCCCILPCISQGFMEAQIRIPGNVYEIGDRLEVFVEVSISSKSVDIVGIELGLKQRFEFHAEGKTKSKEAVIQTATKRGPFRNNPHVKIGLQVPSVLHSGLQHCSIIDVRYRLAVRFMTSDCHCDTKKEYEIWIGSKSIAAAPLPAGDLRSFASPTAPMDLPSVAFPMSGTSSTSPVPVPGTMGDAAAMKSAPYPTPYNPVQPIGFQITSPSAPVDPTSATEPPPPSYESVMAQETNK